MNNESGDPLFYSNGWNVQSVKDGLLENGDSLLPNDYQCQEFGHLNNPHSSGVSLPNFVPGQYIMFVVEQEAPLAPQPCSRNRLVAHYIDMNANNGKGAVTEKAQVILDGCFQEPSANRHANGRDWWILMGDNQQGRFYRWLLTPQGLQGPWMQDIANPIVDGIWYCGWSEFSSDGQRYLVNGCRTGVVVYNFDRCTGLLSDPLLLPNVTDYNDPATFSPDSKSVYVTDSILQTLVQYDLTAPDVYASRTVLAHWDGTIDTLGSPTVFGFMQQGPDGKLYIWAGGSYFMHVIDFPNRKGVECHIRQQAIQLPGNSFAASLYYPRFRLGPIDGSSCDTLGIDNHPAALFRYDLEDTLNLFQYTFTDLSAYLPTMWHWDFGDGQQSAEMNPVHTYAGAGNYTVCLIASNAFSSDTFCRQLTVGSSGLQTLAAQPHARVTPNPFTTDIKVSLPAQVGVVPEFVLYDSFGRQVYRCHLPDFENAIHLEQSPPGLYFWRLFWQGIPAQEGKLIRMGR